VVRRIAGHEQVDISHHSVAGIVPHATDDVADTLQRNGSDSLTSKESVDLGQLREEVRIPDNVLPMCELKDRRRMPRQRRIVAAQRIDQLVGCRVERAEAADCAPKCGEQVRR
jgi:hypothetical protein